MSYLFAIIIAAILTADLLWWWYVDRMLRPLRRVVWWRGLLAVFMGGQAILVLIILGSRFLLEQGWSRPPQALGAAAYLWHLLILPTAAALLMTMGCTLWAWRSGRRFVSPTVAAGDEAVLTTRRQFLGMLTTATPPLLTGGSVIYSLGQLHRFRIRTMELVLPTMPRELDGLRIALVSDMHVGAFTDGRAVRRIVEETNRLQADLVLLPGDLINNDLADLSDALDAVSNMQSRHGAYLSLGNHDLIEDGAEFIRRTKARVPLLVDESLMLSVRGCPIQLLGLPWHHDESRIIASVRRLESRLTPGAFPILLAHHPHAFDAAAEAGIPLTVSGHTHGGQLMLSDTIGFGPLMYRYWSGLYRKPERNDAALVVSNGVGNWFPLRLGASAEIVHLILRAPEARLGSG